MAEVLGGMLASAVLKVVTQQISSAIGGQIKLQKNFNDDLQEMKDTLESIEAVLEEVERRSIKEKPVQLWLKRLRNAVCDISDMIYEFEADTQPPARKLAARISCLTVVPKTCMANKMKKMRQERKKITKQHKDFSFTGGSSSNVQQAIGTRETSSNVEEAKIIGRDKDKQKILASLSGSITQEITILPIYGMGGIGKTTLAQLVFNDTQFEDYSRVWVYVSRTFDLNKISNSIVSQVSKEQSQMTEKEMIQKRLGEVLAGKKILIVLDDLWEKDSSKLDELKSMLKVGEGGKVVVIITTRDEGIAKEIRTVKQYKIEPLTNDTCWTIIKHKSSFDDKPYKEQLELIGRKIAERCEGVALAAQSIGYTLRPMTYDGWESVRNSDIWNVLALEDESSPHHVPASLTLSYSSMPPYLKLCFAYCGIFPKGHNIGKDDIIHQWNSLGFIEQSKIFSPKQLGENYVSHLLGMSFLQHSKSPLSDEMLYDDVTLFTMHDLVHDLARSVMADEVLDASKKGSIGGSSCCYALLTDCSKPLNLSVTSPAKIRALCFLDCGKIELRDAAFSSAKHVRVLDLSGCKIRKLPHSIARLKQLRYLNAPRIHDESLPKCITKLSKLNYLNLHGSHGISTLPESIGEMEGLMHLDLSGCWGIQKLPKSFVNLKDMVHLDLSQCLRVKDIPEALGGLTKLQYLDLSLQYLDFMWLLDINELGEELHLRGLPEVIVSLTKLRYLNLSRCMEFIFDSSSLEEVDSFIGRISTLSNLEHLDLSYNDNLVSIPESIGSLKKLHTLNLSCCRRLERLPKSMAKMDSLKALNVKGCDKLDQSTLSLSSPFVLLQHANPNELKISRLENVKSAQEAQSIKLMKLMEKQRIKELEFAWTRDAERSVEDMEVLGELVPPSTLKRFKIRGFNSVSFPAWLMDIRHFLPNLDKIEMDHLPNCKCLPSLGQLPNLRKLILAHMHGITKIDEGFYGAARAFPQLQEFVLRGMKSLEEWNTTYSSGEEGANELMFPKLQTLRINNCTMLRMKPHPSRAVQWIIERSDNVISSWGETVSHSRVSSSSATVSLKVRCCKVPLHRWRLLRHLCIYNLIISNCSDLTGSPEIVRHLSSLKSLSLEDQGQAELPKWLGELTSLECLDIANYPELKDLQGNMRQLTSLQKLRLSQCGSIASLPPWLAGLTSLKELTISNCRGIKSLPQSIQQLTNLRILRILNCLELKQWCESEKSKKQHAHIKVTYAGP